MSRPPELVGIEYLWEDLDAVRRFLETYDKVAGTEVFKHELELRLSWTQGLRRAWLAATLV